MGETSWWWKQHGSWFIRWPFTIYSIHWIGDEAKKNMTPAGNFKEILNPSTWFQESMLRVYRKVHLTTKVHQGTVLTLNSPMHPLSSAKPWDSRSADPYRARVVPSSWPVSWCLGVSLDRYRSNVRQKGFSCNHQRWGCHLLWLVKSSHTSQNCFNNGG